MAMMDAEPVFLARFFSIHNRPAAGSKFVSRSEKCAHRLTLSVSLTPDSQNFLDHLSFFGWKLGLS